MVIDIEKIKALSITDLQEVIDISLTKIEASKTEYDEELWNKLLNSCQQELDNRINNLFKQDVPINNTNTDCFFLGL